PILAVWIGKVLKLSSPFPPIHTVREIFISYGVPSNPVYQSSHLHLEDKPFFISPEPYDSI
ncbi:hypothetical protein, partial [Bacillus paranthracis]|uniref:hypothetical protein n=1 Tax=Bacillus paranthracis TaxID=2026186 RepID=UPI0028467523|nr:hypothetical protein [Bacillus paranthracis]